MNPFPLLTAGLLLGMEHALDADHGVAVSTIVCETRSLKGILFREDGHRTHPSSLPYLR